MALPTLDLVAIARATRKSLDRLASFCDIRSSTNEPNQVLTKVSSKISNFIRLIDVSILSAQCGYQLASDAMVVCDPEETEWDTDVNIESLKAVCNNGETLAKEAADGFRDIKQEIYKIAASTKDSTFIVLVPPDPSHPETLKMPLKDIGVGLVENQNLLAQFSTAVANMASWWTAVKEDLEAETSTFFPNTPGVVDSSSVANFAMWSDIKDAYQNYYDVISAAQARYPNLLSSSTAAWKSVAVAVMRSANASTVEQGTRAIPEHGMTIDQSSRLSTSSRIWSLFDSVRRSRKRRSSRKKKALAARSADIAEEKDGEKPPVAATSAETGGGQSTSNNLEPPRIPTPQIGSSSSFAGFALYRPRSAASSASSRSSSSVSSSVYSRSRSPGTPSALAAPLSRAQSRQSQQSTVTNNTNRGAPKKKTLFSCCTGDFFDVSIGHLGQYGAGHVM
ncbi:hypothetical protein CPC08DRAFT_709211 [Agrocybe pediades]|nr:hypothetical protein CPC08DRAFT_709211 [Agrocybe pediades]